MDNKLLAAANAIAQAEAIFISAGAGMGVDSGLPDFRGNEGFWRAYPLLRQEGLSFQDLANPQWFYDDPYRAWGFYGHRFTLYQGVVPHQGFNIIQQWCSTKTIEPFVFTSNVDGHFQKSGFHPDSVYECHGSINHLQCVDCCTNDIWALSRLHAIIQKENLVAAGELPRCPHCSAVARPNILMFGDGDWIATRSTHQFYKYDEWQAQHAKARIVTIEMGAGKEIPTARYASDSMPGITVRINPRDADGNKNTISIAMGALEALLGIDKFLRNGV